MRLATIQTDSGPSAAVLVGRHYVDLVASDPSLPRGVKQLLEAGPDALRAAEGVARRPNSVRYDATAVKLLPPVPGPQKIVCLGLNYRDHARETGAAIPAE